MTSMNTLCLIVNKVIFRYKKTRKICKYSLIDAAYCKYVRRQLHVSTNGFQATIIDGRAIAGQILNDVKSEVDIIKNSGFRVPQLTVLLIGNDAASLAYVRSKMKACVYTGIASDTIRMPAKVSQEELLKEVELMNEDPDVDGLLVQLPLPGHMDERAVCNAVDPRKDVDGFNIVNIGSYCASEKSFVPSVSAAVMEIIKRSGIDTFGKHVVVCGRSMNVGLPIAILLQGDGYHGDKHCANATTTICHRNTPPAQLAELMSSADIVVAAAGVPNLITADMVKEGAAVIDVGISRVPHPDKKGRTVLVGDVDFRGVSQKASYITPVPGGVGPCTVAMLMINTLLAHTRELFS